jgi:hypothetical protein
MARRNVQLVCAALLCGGLFGGCLTAEADLSQSDIEGSDVDGVAPARIALRSGATVEPGEFDGYCEKGIGVFLSADDTKALLTVYVVTPAQSAVFVKPTLRLTTQDGDAQSTKVSEFETIELSAGESQVFSDISETPLMDAVAELSAY